jgi:hypothetical protein
MTEGEPVVVAGPWFSRLLVTIIVLMFLTLAIWVVLGVAIAAPSSSQSALIDGMSRAFFGCLGALLGLVGGKLS